jgi:hypothetical protein
MERNMKEFTVRIMATDYCGFEEDYVVMAADEDHAEEIAMEKHLDDFIDAMDLTSVDNGDMGYVESSDAEDWEADPDSVETTTIHASIIL